MKKIIVLSVLLTPLIGYAIEPLVIKLNNASPSYTVPAGKVLLIETLSGTEGNMYNISFIVDGITNRCEIGAYDLDIYHHVSFERPLKIPSETIVTLAYSLSNDLQSYTLFCLLVEPSDLYACIDNQSGNMLVQNGTFSFDVRGSSPRPAKIDVEGSHSLLAEWNKLNGATTVKQKDSSTYTISIPVKDEDKYFAKYCLRSVGN